MKKITLIGSFSGRNAGDIAILANILDDFAEVRNDIQFLIPTLKPSFVTEHYGHHNVKPMGMMPWHLSLKALMPRAVSLNCPTSNVCWCRFLPGSAISNSHRVSGSTGTG